MKLSKERILEYLRKEEEEANRLACEAMDKIDMLDYAHKGERADTYRKIIVFCQRYYKQVREKSVKIKTKRRALKSGQGKPIKAW